MLMVMTVNVIQYPEVNATPIDIYDVLDKDGVIQINFEGRVAYFG